MSSNMEIKKVCEYCKNIFIAKKTTSKCCSDDCAKRLYKQRKRNEKIQTVEDETQNVINTNHGVKTKYSKAEEKITQDFITIKVLSASTGYSRSTLFRLMAKDNAFPKVQISSRGG